MPLTWESGLLDRMVGQGTWMQAIWPAMADWISYVHAGISSSYPFLQYGTDWLAFAHVVITIAFVGVLRDPLRNQWVIELGMIACVLIVPTALIFGPVRGIPFFWRLIDCSFGVLGLVPLGWVWRDLKRLEKMAGA